jgi:hypothetical protein
MKRLHWSEFALWGVAIIAVILAAGPAFAQSSKPSVERGGYLAKIPGCNDCYTANYGISGGQTPKGR